MAMQCEHFERVQEYLDGRLEGRAAAEARAHLDACRDCARGSGTLEAVSAAFRADVRRDPGPEFTAAVMGAVRSAVAMRGAAPAWTALSRWEAVGLAALYALAAALLPKGIAWLGGVQTLAGWLPSPAALWDGAKAWAYSLSQAPTLAAGWQWAGWVETPAGLSAAAAAALLLVIALRPPAALQRIAQDPRRGAR